MKTLILALLLTVTTAIADPLPPKVQSAYDDVVEYFGREPDLQTIEGSGDVQSYQWRYLTPTGKLMYMAVAVHLASPSFDIVYTVMQISQPFIRQFNQEVPLIR